MINFKAALLYDKQKISSNLETIYSFSTFPYDIAISKHWVFFCIIVLLHVICLVVSVNIILHYGVFISYLLFPSLIIEQKS